MSNPTDEPTGSIPMNSSSQTPAPPSKDDYAVGYGKPPKHGRFRKGVSGNPKGRKPASKSRARRLADILAERIAYRRDGVEVTEPLENIIFRKHANKSAQGDVRSFHAILNAMSRYGLFDLPPEHDESISEADEEILKHLVARFTRADSK